MPHLAWDKGGDADLTALDDDRVNLRSTRASAPGSRIDGSLASGERVRVKIHRCKRTGAEPPVFELEGRLLDAPRELRDTLAKLAAG